ncbi:hypothetical protein [Diaphorobacter sp. J5-51]|uniref:hypothetical protein n=1 Tax=Diaphorobacter sp. J5-51 TaxID=680496 RepID=UPI0006433183|nr:hypothetical protein [Diaphorobacter sp. J5-51]
MPCYIQKIQPPSRENYQLWLSMGFLGSWEDYCRTKTRNVGGTFTLCGDLGSHCADCSAVGDYLCDYPVGDDKTCDRPMCGHHAKEIGPNMHYCRTHKTMWDAYVCKSVKSD